MELHELGTRRLLDRLTDAVVAADRDQRIVYANAAAERLLGWAAGELVGRLLVSLMPERMQAAHLAGFTRFSRTGETRIAGRPVRVPAQHRDGTELDVELRLSVFEDGPDLLVVAVLRDLRDRVELERQLRNSRHLRAASEAAAALTSKLERSHVVTTAVDALTDGFDAALGLLWLVEPGGATLRLEGRAGACTAPDLGSRASLEPATSAGPLGLVARTKRSFVQNGLLADPGLDAAWVAAERLESAAILPLLIGGELRGVLAGYFRHALDPELTDVLATFATTVAAALNDADLLERARAAHRDSESSRQVYRDLVDAVDHAIVWSARPETLSFTFVSPRAEQITGFPPEQWQSVPGFWAKHVHPEDRAMVQALFAAAREGADAGVEHRFVTADGRVIWLHTGVRLARRGDGAGHELRGMSTNISRLKQVEESLRRSLALQRFLSEAGRVLASSLDLGVTLSSVAQLAVPTLADWCAVEIVREDLPGGRQYSVAHVDPARLALANELRARFPTPADAPLGVPNVLRTGRPELYPTVTDEMVAAQAQSPEHLQLLRELGVRSVMIAPLVLHGRTVGVIVLVMSDSGRRLTEDDLPAVLDLSHRAALAIENARLYHEARQAIQARDTFLMVASHEIRTPLTSAKLQIDALVRRIGQDGDADGRLAKRALAARRQVDRLATLVAQLLDMSQISGAGGLRLQPEPLDLAELLRSVVDRFEDDAARAGSRLTLDAAPSLAGQWDAVRLDTVLTNLVGNAVKYGAGKPISITAARAGDRIRVVVRDEGIGIAPEHQARIFERFERAVSPEHYGGFGLGLWIVRRIVEAMQGTIAVTSEPGRGTSFTLELPSSPPPG